MSRFTHNDGTQQGAEESGLNSALRLTLRTLQRNSEGQEISAVTSEGPDGFMVATIRRTPGEEPGLYISEEGVLISDWSDKFRREKEGQIPPFSPGELIRVQGIVTLNEKRGECVFHVDADGRAADNFYLDGTADEKPLAEHAGLPLTVIIRVGKERKSDFRLSDIWNYDASFVAVDAVSPVNPAADALEALPTGTRVVVEGVFLGFSGKPKNEWHDRYDSGTVRTDDGREIYIDFPTGQITFSEGVLENLERKVPEAGDRIAVGAFVSRARRGSSASDPGFDAGVRPAAHWCDPCVLRVPSAGRKSTYESLRTAVVNNLARIETQIRDQNWGGVRSLIGCTRKMELIDSELDAVDAIVQSIPQSERPVIVSRDRYDGTNPPHFWAAAIDTAYGVIIESMSRDEFAAFLRSAATGERIQTGKGGTDTSYLYGIAMEVGIETQIIEGALTECLEKRLPKLRGVPYVHDKHWDDKYNIGQALGYLAGLGTPRSVQKVLDLLYDLIEKREFHKTGWREQHSTEFSAGFVFEAAHALDTHPGENCRKTLRDNLPELIKARETLEQEGDEPVALRSINRVIEFAAGNTQ